MSNDAKATSTRRPGRPKAGSEDKKARILSEALTLFSTQGYVATSLADIARASDISKAGLLHHYSSKDQLLAAVLDERDRRIVSRLPRPEEGAEAALDAWVDMVAHNQRHPDGVALYTAMSAAVIDSKHQAAVCATAAVAAGSSSPMMASALAASSMAGRRGVFDWAMGTSSSYNGAAGPIAQW